jgi:hypothetical protein
MNQIKKKKNINQLSFMSEIKNLFLENLFQLHLVPQMNLNI